MATVLVPAQILLSVPVEAVAEAADLAPARLASPSSATPIELPARPPDFLEAYGGLDALQPLPSEAAEVASPSEPPQVPVNRTAPAVDPPPLYPVFTAVPSDEEISKARVFGEPLLPVGGKGSPEENQALAAAISSYLRSGNPEAADPLESFLKDHPDSPWRASLRMNLGVMYRARGYFSRAEKALGEAWDLARGGDEPYAKATGARALSELLEIHMQFGRVEPLEALVDQVEGITLSGGVVEHVRNARSAAWVLRNDHGKAIPSGPVALGRILARTQPGRARPAELNAFHATPNGASLAEMAALARSVGLKLRMAYRTPRPDPGSPLEIPVPSLVHLKAGHFSALVEAGPESVHLDDPLLGGDVWMSRQAFEEEASGYFLAPEQTALPSGWRDVEERDVAQVRGKCAVPALDWLIGTMMSATSAGGSGNFCPRMAVYRFSLMAANTHIQDTPVGHSPPRGPSLQFTVAYNQREASQPQTFTFSNLGSRWTNDWLSYVEDDPGNPAANAKHNLRAGGQNTYTGFSGDSYAPQIDNQTVLVRTSTSPIRYERRLPDGSVEVFALADGAATFPRRIFMTQAIDPQGNSVSFTYDAQLRLVSATDAIGQVATLSYDLTADPLKITRVTDPFGRTARFEYDSSGRLIRITDVIGITSEFSYAASGDFISSLTTPYGTTAFTTGSGPNIHTDFWSAATDPLGGQERVDYLYTAAGLPSTEPASSVPTGFASENVSMNNWSSYFFDKRAQALYPWDYTKAYIVKWRQSDYFKLADVKHSEKRPLENRVWYAYEGAPEYNYLGSMALPTKIARVLDDASSQIYRYEYNSKGKITRKTDPLGRATIVIYDTNDIDLKEVRQANGQTNELVQSNTFNSQHQPLTMTDAAGKTWTYTYNAQGQVLTLTNPKNETTTYSYNADGYLMSVTGPAPGATTTYTYDGYGRVRTVTDSEGYTVTNDYDALDRVTKITYPDGTYEQFVYNRLDAEGFRDRLGKWTHTFHDALRREIAKRDPLGRTTTQQWCTCGSLDKLIDGNGSATTWERDVQGRVTRELMADGNDVRFTYENTTSRVKQRTDQKGQVAGYTYNPDNTLAQISYTNAQNPTPTVSFTYDPAFRRLATMQDGTGTTGYSYYSITAPPALGAARLASIDGPISGDTDKVTYTYDELGRVLSRSINGVASSQTYDALGRVGTETNPLGTFTYTYVGTTERVASISYPNGQTTTYAYFDNLGDHRLQEIHNKLSGGATLSKQNYTYRPVGSVATWTQQLDANPAKVYELTYDAAEELSAATFKTTGTPATILKRYGYAYDGAGNRTTEQIDDAATAATHNNLNELVSQQPGGALLFRGTLSEPATVTVAGKPAQVGADNTFQGTSPVPSGTSTVAVTATDPSGNVRTNTYQVSQTGAGKTLTYDLTGNLTSDGTRTFEWDAANRLTAVVQGTQRSEFTYDGNNRRVRVIEKDGATVLSDRRFLWCEMDICEERDAAGTTVTKRFYSYGVQEGSSTFFYAKDHLASIRELTDSSGAVRARYDYDPYGRTTKVSGDKDSTFTFTGHLNQTRSGLALAPLRAYEPAFGRWISADPIGLEGGVNFYSYVQNNPANDIDPTGLAAMNPGGIRGIGCTPQQITGCQNTCLPNEVLVGCWGIPGIIAMCEAEAPCTPLRHATLQNLVNASCKVPRACSAGMSCDELKRRAALNAACAAARQLINNECFRGGDPNHQGEAQRAQGTGANCVRLMVMKGCK